MKYSKTYLYSCVIVAETALSPKESLTNKSVMTGIISFPSRSRGIISDFYLGGTKKAGRAKRAQSAGGFRGLGGAVTPLPEKSFILSYFMCCLKPHEQVIFIKSMYSHYFAWP